jgi:hypothetical protein
VKKISHCAQSIYYELFGVAAYKSDIKFIKFKMADPKWRTYFEKKNSYGSESMYRVSQKWRTNGALRCRRDYRKRQKNVKKILLKNN